MAERPDESALREAVQRLAGAWTTYGYRSWPKMLAREGFVANAQRACRVMADLDIQKKSPLRRPRTTNSQPAFLCYENLVETPKIARAEQG